MTVISISVSIVTIMRTWTTQMGARALQVLAQRHAGAGNTGSTAARRALLLSGLGLSVLAAAQTDLAGCNNAQCDARYSPAYHGGNAFDDAAELDVTLDGERFGLIQNSRANGFTCATYKANMPIEDRFDVKYTDSGDVFATVLDGHGGWQVSEYGSKVLIQNIQQELVHMGLSDEKQSEAAAAPMVAAAIQRGFARTDRDLMAQVLSAFKLGFGSVGRCGSCALLAYLHDNTLCVANAGDIRAVLGRKDGKDVIAVAMSNDQNAMSRFEQEKLKREHPGEENVFICRHPDSCYVKGALQPTRALGDFALKYSEFNGPPYVNGDRSAGRHISPPYTPPYITAIPEVRTHTLEETDQFLIIGSDGLWDYLSNEEAVEIVQEHVANGHRERASRALVEKVLQKAAARYDMTYAELLSLPPGSHRRRRHDDTTVVILYFE
ncbi:TPA: hypothetical protein N0F65_005798 [Lagenidium giganteum]|uniref:PPM-type phosphatase domain-containing protein n=1 Tax=Lagenidium giganteum TaxID=4803 RepID=A0AAV2YID2_9STRA|nr:TPA: hypothetical protein N0F65_005798 [Lagenidium giganteum]